jgi:16S rRNA (guanine527-N7)-methyltransferase
VSSPTSDGHSILARGLSQLRIPDAGRAVPLLEKHLEELEKWNGRHGLVKASGTDLIVKHVLDSLAAWEIIRDLVRPGESMQGSVLDVGSGAGFPGIPLAVVLPGISFVLVERSSVRAAFLSNCALLLGMANVSVLESDLSRVSGRFEVVTMRAFSPLARLLGDLSKSKVRWDAIAAYKGKGSRLEEELEEIRGSVDLLVEIRKIEVPFLDEERHMAIIRRK